jgi:hypothetical protein
MIYIFSSLFLFSVSVMAHIIYCSRSEKPGLHAKVFILIALVFFAVYVTLVLAWQHSPFLSPRSLLGMPFKITSGVVFILFIPVYLCFYTLTQLMSPSKKILLEIARRGDLSYDDILLSIEQEDFIGTLLNDLLSSGCAIETGGRYHLTPEGQSIAMVLDIMQRVLGRGMGG